MSATYVSLHYHLVFGTRNRIPFITPEILPHLHSYLGGTIRGIGGVAEAVGGVQDHVHLLVSLKSTAQIADVLRELKKSSSAWMRGEAGQKNFHWQEGYGAFTVSATTTARGTVRRYIARQEEHHRKKTFEEEVRAMLKLAEMEYVVSDWV